MVIPVLLDRANIPVLRERIASMVRTLSTPDHPLADDTTEKTLIGALRELRDTMKINGVEE